MINERNTAAIEQTLAQLTRLVYAQQTEINDLRTTIASLLERLAESERGVLLLRAAVAGHGPSVKG